MPVLNSARNAKLAGSLNKAFGEAFDIEPMLAQADVNDRFRPDGSRTAIIGVTGIWDGPARSVTPAARGSVADDKAHNWTASFPSANFAEADLAWTPRRGDKLTRKLDGSIFQVDRTYPSGFGWVTLQLTARKQPPAPVNVVGKLVFTKKQNSQYVPLI